MGVPSNRGSATGKGVMPNQARNCVSVRSATLLIGIAPGVSALRERAALATLAAPRLVRHALTV